MKLSDLYEDKAMDFELEKMQIPNFDDKNSKFIGTFDGYSIYGNRYNPKIDAYGILIDTKTVAVIFIQTKESLYDGHKCQQIEKLWVNPKFRGKGLAISLLAFIIRKTKTSLISNKIISSDGEELYKKIILKQTFAVGIYNTATDSASNIVPKNLFDYPNNYRIILISPYDTASQDNEMFESHEKGYLSHYRLFVGLDGTSEWD